MPWNLGFFTLESLSVWYLRWLKMHLQCWLFTATGGSGEGNHCCERDAGTSTPELPYAWAHDRLAGQRQSSCTRSVHSGTWHWTGTRKHPYRDTLHPAWRTLQDTLTRNSFKAAGNKWSEWKIFNPQAFTKLWAESFICFLYFMNFPSAQQQFLHDSQENSIAVLNLVSRVVCKSILIAFYI